MTAVIFDCDGTLVDSEPLARRAWERVLEPRGYSATPGDFDAVTGLPFARTHAYFAERARLPAAGELWEAYAATLFGLYDEALAPFPDALGALEDLRARGISVGVASSSPRARLDHTLRLVGLRDAFAVSVAGDEVEHGKPAPDMFLAAAARLDASPRACVVVEDSPPGVAAGVAAGMATLGICRVPGTEATLAAADRVVDALTAEAILALVPA